MDKRLELDAAIAAYVKPRMSVHCTTHARAAVRALQRVLHALHGQDADLTLIMARIGGGWAADLVASGLVKRVVAGSYGAVGRAYTGRLPQVDAAYASGSVAFQHWSFWTLMQRLIAAAQGQPYALTHSLAGSSLAQGNDDYREVLDPFGSGRTVGVVRALHPDVAILHVDACDEEGNAILLPPFEEGAWGAKAARDGAIVTAERIVDHAFIRRHAHLVKLPARYVRAVCHVPFGAHPGPFGQPGELGFDGYVEDDAFSSAYIDATRDEAKLRAWVDRWIIGIPDHDTYLEQLGAERLTRLKASCAAAQAAALEPVAVERAPTSNEVLTTLALREVMRRTVASGCDVYLVGAGLSEVPATAAWHLLKQQGVDIYLTMGHGYFDFEPVAGRTEPDPSMASMTTDAPEIYGVILGGRIGATLAILGAAQVDCHGNLNSTLVDGKLLVGSGGSNDASSACETLVVTRAGRRKLVGRVEYDTCCGQNVRAVITEKGVFEKVGDAETLSLTRFVDLHGVGRERILDDIAQHCGWPLEVSEALACEPPPTPTELDLIRRLMPTRYE